MGHASSRARNLEPLFDDLVGSIDDLLNRISDIDTPEIKIIRTKVHVALAAAKSAWRDAGRYANHQVMDTLRRPGDYLRESPWRAFGIATVLGIGLGAALTRRRGS